MSTNFYYVHKFMYIHLTILNLHCLITFLNTSLNSFIKKFYYVHTFVYIHHTILNLYCVIKFLNTSLNTVL